jgi:hypothetical protein
MYTRPIYYSQPAQSINQQHHHSPVLVTPTHTYYPSFVPSANIHPDTLIPLVTYENTVCPNYIGTQHRSTMSVYQNNIPTINSYTSTIDSYDPDWVITPVSILPDEQYKCIGYKLAGIEYGYLVKLGIPHDAKHNMDRSCVVNAERAQYITNKVHVLSIVHVNTADKINCIESHRESNKIYKVNNQIVSNFDDNLDKFFTSGIHFYLSEEILKHAFRDTGIRMIKEKLTVTEPDYNENGKLICETYYENGEVIKIIVYHK